MREQQERDKELAEKRKTAQLEMQRQLEELRATQSTKQASDEPKVGGLGLMGRLGGRACGADGTSGTGAPVWADALCVFSSVVLCVFLGARTQARSQAIGAEPGGSRRGQRQRR